MNTLEIDRGELRRAVEGVIEGIEAA